MREVSDLETENMSITSKIIIVKPFKNFISFKKLKTISQFAKNQLLFVFIVFI